MLKVLAATENKETNTSMLTIMVDIPYVLLPELLQHKELSVTYKKLEDIPLQDILKNPFTPALLRQSNVGKLALKAENFQEAKNLWLRNLKDKDVFEVWWSEDGTIESQYDSDANQKEDSGRGDGRFSDFCEIPTLKSNYHELSKLLNCEKSAKLLLTPFAYTTCIISSTNWNEFFEDFCPKYHTPVSGTGFYAKSKKELISWHSDADNVKKLEDENFDWSAINWSKARLEWQVIAEQIYDLREETLWKNGEYHIPFETEIRNLYGGDIGSLCVNNDSSFDNDLFYNLLMKISASMCAKLSYNTQDNEDTLEKHLERANMLIESKYQEPFSHQAVAMTFDECMIYCKTYLIKDKSKYEDENDIFSTKYFCKHYQGNIYHVEERGVCYNLRGYKSFRYIIENE